MPEDDGDDREHTWVRVYGEQKMFLEREALRLRRERFSRARDLSQVSMAETLAALIEELRRLRALVAGLQHGVDAGQDAQQRDNGSSETEAVRSGE